MLIAEARKELQAYAMDSTEKIACMLRTNLTKDIKGHVDAAVAQATGVIVAELVKAVSK